MGGGSNRSFDQFKRAFLDLVHELHARKLAIPAGAVLVAILAAIFMLPKAPSAPPPAAAVPVADQSQPVVNSQEVVQLKLVGVSSLDDGVPLSNSTDPFTGSGATKCVRIGNSTPKKFQCRIGDLTLIFSCVAGDVAGICGATGSSGATGASGTSGGSGTGAGGSTPTTGGTPNPSPNPNPNTTPKTQKSTYYEVSVTLDGRTYKHVKAGDGLPNDKSALALYAGVSSSNKKAIFIGGDGVVVTGVPVDSGLGNFELAKGRSATLTDTAGAAHTLKLNSITKVTK